MFSLRGLKIVQLVKKSTCLAKQTRKGILHSTIYNSPSTNPHTKPGVAPQIIELIIQSFKILGCMLSVWEAKVWSPLLYRSQKPSRFTPGDMVHISKKKMVPLNPTHEVGNEHIKTPLEAKQPWIFLQHRTLLGNTFSFEALIQEKILYHKSMYHVHFHRSMTWINPFTDSNQ